MDYPTQEELDRIKNWDNGDPRGLLAYIQSIWNDHYGRCEVKGKKVLRAMFATGGWSGNEDILNALQETMFWSVYWEKSERGGRYTFIIR